VSLQNPTVLGEFIYPSRPARSTASVGVDQCTFTQRREAETPRTTHSSCIQFSRKPVEEYSTSPRFLPLTLTGSASRFSFCGTVLASFVRPGVQLFIFPTQRWHRKGRGYISCSRPPPAPRDRSPFPSCPLFESKTLTRTPQALLFLQHVMKPRPSPPVIHFLRASFRPVSRRAFLFFRFGAFFHLFFPSRIFFPSSLRVDGPYPVFGRGVI